MREAAKAGYNGRPIGKCASIVSKGRPVVNKTHIESSSLEWDRPDYINHSQTQRTTAESLLEAIWNIAPGHWLSYSLCSSLAVSLRPSRKRPSQKRRRSSAHFPP